MYELLKKCWEKDEDKRPSASEVYAKIEKLFNSFLWNKFENYLYENYSFVFSKKSTDSYV